MAEELPDICRKPRRRKETLIYLLAYGLTLTIRGFCIGKKKWVMIDAIASAGSNAIIYSTAETAKENDLKPYDYYEYLLTEIPKHLDDTDRTFLDDLLLWTPGFPANCRKPSKDEVK